MRLDRRIAVVLALVAAGCAGVGPSGPGGGYDGGDPYHRDDPYYSRTLSRHEARLRAEEQALEEQRLRRLQRERRENLLERQDRRRNELEAEGEWTQGDARRQHRARRAQQERFEEQRGELRDSHDREWDR